KKEGADPERLRKWITAAGVDTVLNRRGTTFRKLSDAEKADVDEAKAVTLLQQHPSMIKRPVVEYPGGLLVGFKEDEWAAALSCAHLRRVRSPCRRPRRRSPTCSGSPTAARAAGGPSIRSLPMDARSIRVRTISSAISWRRRTACSSPGTRT